MKKIFFIIFLSATSPCVHAQIGQLIPVDSLRSLLFSKDYALLNNQVAKMKQKVDTLLNDQYYTDLLSLEGSLRRKERRYTESLRLHKKVLSKRLQFYGSQHFMVANTQLNLANTYIDLNRFTESLPLLRQAESITPQDPELLISMIYTLLGIKEFSEAETYLAKLNQNKSRNISFQIRKKRVAAQVQMTVYNYEKAQETLQEAFKIANINPEIGLLPDVLIDLATCAQHMGKFRESRRYLSDAMVYLDSQEKSNPQDYILTNLNLGNAFHFDGAYEAAEICFNKAIKFSEKNQDRIGQELAIYGLSRLANDQGNYEKARTLIEEFLENPNSPDTYYTNALLFLNRGISNLNDTSQTSAHEAERDFQNALKILANAQYEPLEKEKIILYLALSFFKQKKYSQALELYKSINNKDNITENIEKETNIADCLFQLGHKEKALKGLEFFFLQISQDLSSNNQGKLKILEALCKLHLEKEDPDWNSIYNFSSQGIKLIEAISKRSYNYHVLRNINQEFNFLYDAQLKACMHFNDMNAALQTMELYSFNKSKRLYLMQIRDQKFAALSRTYDRQQDLLQQVQFEIYQLEKFQVTPKAIINQKKQAFLDLSMQQMSIDDSIKQYLEEKSGYYTKADSVETIIDQLPANASLIQFYWGSQNLFCFYINKNRIFLNEIPIDINFTEDLRNIYAGFSSPPKNGNPNAEQAIMLAHRVYKKIITPLELQPEEQLIIIPDGILCLIPFGALVSKQSDDIRDWDSHEYLIDQHNITYVFSQSSLNNKPRNSPIASNHSILAIAPQFSPDSNFELEYNQEEVQYIKNISKSKVYNNPSVLKQDIWKQAPKYPVLHFATHAFINDSLPIASFIALSSDDSTVTDDHLYAYEISQQKDINSQLVFLSSCTSAKGKFQYGEGMQSLASSFLDAGAGSVIGTLWQINDQTATYLVKSYYEELRKTKNSTLALFFAQRKVRNGEISDAKDAYPYYWAAFNHYGLAQSLEISPRRSYEFTWWLKTSLIGLILLFCLGFFFRTR